MMSKMTSGFTLMEVLMVMAIGVIVSSIVIAGFDTVSTGQALDADRSSVVSMLNQARLLSMAGKDGSPHGVHLSSDEAVLFIGSVYDPESSSNTKFDLDGRVELTGSGVSEAGFDVVFKKLSGATDNAVSLSVVLKSSSGTERHIAISQSGVIDTN